jgi:hypothetical protein
MRFNDINIYDWGNTIHPAGSIYSKDGETYLVFFPNTPKEHVEENKIVPFQLNDEQWKTLIKQLDLLETEILTKSPDGQLVKTILRKSQRQISQHISWNAFRRDSYTCRYCANKNLPLTVDHIVLYEDGGPDTEENLISSCKPCNKARGNMKYDVWLKSPFYKKVSNNLSVLSKEINREVLDKIDLIQKVQNIKSR